MYSGLISKVQKLASSEDSLNSWLKVNTPSIRLWLSALAAVIYIGFFINLVALHFVRSEFDPVSKSISHYVIGPFGYLLTIALFAVGLGALTLSYLLYQSVSPSPRFGSLFLAISGAFTLIVAIVPTDIRGDVMPVSEITHNAAFSVSFFTLVVSMFFFTRGFKQDSQWRAFYTFSSWVSFLMLAAMLAFTVTAFTLWVGVTQRFAVFTVNIWLILVSVKLILIAATDQRLIRNKQEKISEIKAST